MGQVASNLIDAEHARGIDEPRQTPGTCKYRDEKRRVLFSVWLIFAHSCRPETITVMACTADSYSLRAS
jgi:hypothetical protein